MEHRVHGAMDFDVARNVLPEETEIRVREQVGNVGIGAGDKIVEAKDFPALFEEVFAQMGAEEARSACNHDTQLYNPARWKCVYWSWDFIIAEKGGAMHASKMNLTNV